MTTADWVRDAIRRAVLHQLLVEGRSLVTDAEVFQQILHRFHATRR
jgi:hypothetical protein